MPARSSARALHPVPPAYERAALCTPCAGVCVLPAVDRSEQSAGPSSFVWARALRRWRAAIAVVTRTSTALHVQPSNSVSAAARLVSGLRDGSRAQALSRRRRTRSLGCNPRELWTPHDYSTPPLAPAYSVFPPPMIIPV
ncbi:hypothetical protein VTO73DRAFT_6126 [Trametes versicolor]